MEDIILEIKNIIIPFHDYQLAARLHFPAGKPRALALISHGLFSSKDSEKLTRLASALASAGHLALIFDHLGCGESPGDIGDTSLTSRRQEFLAGVAMLKDMEPGRPLVFLGSSFGGTVALLATELEKPICSLHWSTPWDYAALHEALDEDDERPILHAMVRDFPGHDLDALLARSSRMLLVHGDSDEVVPKGQAIRAHELTRDPKELLLLPGGDHRLSKLEDQKQAIAHSLAWIEQFTD
jgi:uncharacterized protein